jgi:diguanylate cyclase (GGDEF)-like protein
VRRALEEAIGTSSDRSCGFLDIDIDNFQVFNNKYGHRVGDAALVEFANRLVEAVGGDGELFRLGGEEFLAVFPNASLDMACTIAERLCERTRNEPFESSDAGASTLTTSIGVACAPGHGATLDAVWGAAERAMHESKRGMAAIDGRSRRTDPFSLGRLTGFERPGASARRLSYHRPTPSKPPGQPEATVAKSGRPGFSLGPLVRSCPGPQPAHDQPPDRTGGKVSLRRDDVA